MVSPPKDWWPIAESNPVPGDPETLAALGKHMKNAAAAIQQMASQLTKLGSSEVWDSDAGEAFREKAKSVAADITKAHGRFQAVATALGTSTYAAAGAGGYAAQLQEYQDQAYTAAEAVVGTAGAGGSEAKRLSTWHQLLTANHGQSPLAPPPPGGNKPGKANPAAAADPYGTVFPQATPYSIPADLPVFPTDTAEVKSLKATYNEQLATLRSSAGKVSDAAQNIMLAAQRAASMIHQVTDHDGLNNPGWLASAWHSFTSFVSSHWVGFLKEVSRIAALVGMVAGIIAMVLAFIPGLQEVAAVFEAISLIAQAVGFVCDAILAVTGHGDWTGVILDGIGLLTFGLGGGMIGKLGDAAEAVSKMSKAFKDVEEAADAGDALAFLKAGDKAMDSLEGAEGKSLLSQSVSKVLGEFKLKTIVGKAIKSVTNPEDAEQIENLAKLKTLTGLKSGLLKGLKGLTLQSPEALEELPKMIDEADAMNVTKFSQDIVVGADGSVDVYTRVLQLSNPVANVLVDTSEVYKDLFPAMQAIGLAAGGITVYQNSTGG